MLMDITKAIQENIFIVFLIAFLIYYFIVIKRDFRGVFFILSTLIILYVVYDKQRTKEEKKNSGIVEFIENKEKTLDKSEIPTNKFVSIHKLPGDLKYLKRSDDLQKIVFELKFLEKYDKGLYDKIIGYLEHFLILHYKIMTGRYKFENYFPILKDIRNEILNSMKSIIFNTPRSKSTFLDKDNVEQFIDDKIIMVQAITYKYMKSLFHKYKIKHMNYNPPFENDMMNDKYYHIF